MIDKQIIIDDLKEMIYKLQIECAEKTDNILALGEQLKHKEQECEGFKELYNYYAFDRRKPENITELKICINGVNEELIRLQQENEELTTKCSQLEESFKETADGLLKIQYALADHCNKYSKTLAEIKPILEFYANSKIGEEQPDRTYKIMLSGGYIMVYDPKPAREALRKINEVEDVNNDK
jgi:chromosome segregation ATPase